MLLDLIKSTSVFISTLSGTGNPKSLYTIS